jgi:leader peptidase (prepilin peptidase)/N-methyltransferase
MLYIIATLMLAAVLARVTWIDFKTFRLPDFYTLPLIGAGLVIAPFEGGTTLPLSMLGGALGFTVFWAIGSVYFARLGTEALGLGDAKLFAASGTWLGAYFLPQVLLIASVTGLAFALIFARGKAAADSRRIAFGPWLALGFLTVWLKAVFL